MSDVVHPPHGTLLPLDDVIRPMLRLVPPRTCAEDLRLRQAMTRLVDADRDSLCNLLAALRRETARYGPMTAAFGCLVVAELSLLRAGMPLDDASHSLFRTYAVEVAEQMAPP